MDTKNVPDSLRIWFDKPAGAGTAILNAGGFSTSAEDNQWQQFTLPLGNSYMGANVYGEIVKERLTFNHKTLWNGGPSAARPNYRGGNKAAAANRTRMAEVFTEVVSLFLKGDDSAASALCSQMVGEEAAAGYGAYQSWGDIYLNFAGISEAAPVDYVRDLDLTSAVAQVDFTKDNTRYHREYFISYPDRVLVMKLLAEGTGKLNFNISFPVDNVDVNGEGTTTDMTMKNLGKITTVTAAGDTLVTAGQLQDNQMKMNAVLKVVLSDGSVKPGSDARSLDVINASSVVIYVSANTDYKNEYPVYRTGETDTQLAAEVAQNVNKAIKKGYDKVKADHLADYQKIFGRVTLNMGQIASDKPTDRLLAAYNANTATGPEKRQLEVLLYQYGRFLTIASSREGDLPSNLQGVWQNRVGDHGRVPWACDYHINVNLQMNYWPVYSANMAECAVPLIDYVESLRKPGRVTAADYFGIVSSPGEAKGFSAHTQNTPFGWTCPGWDFSWGWSPAAVPWILQNCWEYYEYSGDVNFMRERLYPMMKEEVLLYEQILTDSGQPIVKPNGEPSTRLVSVPAFSPEHGPRTLGNVYEQALVWQLYEDTITAAKILNVDTEDAARWKTTRDRLSPIEVGSDGQIKEWYTETALGSVSKFQNTHRHLSHLLGLFPGDLISVDNNTYMDAAIVSLKERGMTSTGWGMGQRLNSWARTGDGNKAYQLIGALFNSGIYPNLWDTHAPFQIDGNFGYTSGVNEMLLQSNMGYINILPALPDAWSSGAVNGLVARGNFEVGIEWADGKAQTVSLLSKNGGNCVVLCAGIGGSSPADSGGKPFRYETLGPDRISFATAKGETYTLNFGKIPAGQQPFIPVLA